MNYIPIEKTDGWIIKVEGGCFQTVVFLGKKIDNRKNGIFDDTEKTPKKNIAEGFSDIDVDENADGDEYIYYNGKMVKRSVLLKLKNDENTKGVQE